MNGASVNEMIGKTVKDMFVLDKLKLEGAKLTVHPSGAVLSGGIHVADISNANELLGGENNRTDT